MCAALVGDLQWLVKVCEKDGEMEGCRLTCLSGEEGDLNEFVSTSDVIVMVTDQVPHAVRRHVLNVASVNDVPVYMRHSCGASTMQACLNEVVANS